MRRTSNYNRHWDYIERAIGVTVNPRNGAVLVLAISFGFAQTTGALEAQEALEKLRLYDSIYESGFTVTGTQISRDFRSNTELKKQWRLTSSGDRAAYLMDTVEYGELTFNMPNSTRAPNIMRRDGALRFCARSNGAIGARRYPETTEKKQS